MFQLIHSNIFLLLVGDARGELTSLFHFLLQVGSGGIVRDPEVHKEVITACFYEVSVFISPLSPPLLPPIIFCTLLILALIIFFELLLMF